MISEILEDDDIDMITDDISDIKATRKAHKRIATTSKIKVKVRSTLEKAKDDYKAAKAVQRANIKRSKQNIKSYKLLKKQALNQYKLTKLNHKG